MSMLRKMSKLLELTLAIIKPHVIKQPIALQGVRDRIIAAGFKIVRSKRKCMSLNETKQFYMEHRQKFFYNRLTTFMSSGPSDFYILARWNAISEWRRLMGPTKVFRAQFEAPDTIRGTYGLSDTRNATHGSDSPETAEREIRIVFPHFNLKSWYENEEPFYRNNRLQFLREQFIHIPNI